MSSAGKQIWLVLLFCAASAAQPSYPFGFTKVGQASGFSSLCQGIQSGGMYDSSEMGVLTSATWSAAGGGMATLTLQANTTIHPGDTIRVIGVQWLGYDGTFTAATASGTTVTYALPTNPGGSGTVGYVLGPADTLNPGGIINATWNAGTVTLTVNGASSSYPINVVGVNPASYNVNGVIPTRVNPTTITYPLASDPGAYVGGGYITTRYRFWCNMIVPWSGGANYLDGNGNFGLAVIGGGHSNYEGNEVMGLGGFQTSPAWSVITQPTMPVPLLSDEMTWEALCAPPNQSQSFTGTLWGGLVSSQCAPGVPLAPASRETYSGLVYVPGSPGYVYMFGGAAANSGRPSWEVWRLDPVAQTWELLQTRVGNGAFGYHNGMWDPVTAYNPGSGHIVLLIKSNVGNSFTFNAGDLIDFDPNINTFTKLATRVSPPGCGKGGTCIADGFNGEFDPANDQLVVAGIDNGSCGYPCSPSGIQKAIYEISLSGVITPITDASCNPGLYGNPGMAWWPMYNLMTIYPGGGDQVTLVNTNSTDVVTPLGTVPAQKCLAVTATTNPNPVMGVDYPWNPDGPAYGIYGRWRHNPQNDTFVLANSVHNSAWVASLNSSAPSFTLSITPTSLTIQQANQGMATVTTNISYGFNSDVALSASGVPAGTSVTFNPADISAPGSGTSTMTVAVGANTSAGTYSITVTGTGGGVQQSATLSLTVTAAAPQFQAGFDFRSTAGFVTDPANTTYVQSNTLYPTTRNGVTFGWVNTVSVTGRDRNSNLDPRLAGINYVPNGHQATFYVDLPTPGDYAISLALGDAGYQQCWVQCQIQFLDGSTVLKTLSVGDTLGAYFYDAAVNNWSAAAWPGSNVTLPVSIGGNRLSVIVGSPKLTGDFTTVAFLGVTLASQ